MKINKMLALASLGVAIMLTACSGTTDSNAADESEYNDVPEQTGDPTQQNEPEIQSVAPQTQSEDDLVINLTNDNVYRPGQNVDKLTVFDFNATWCVPCKKLTPSFHEAAKRFEGKADFIAVDVDLNPQTARAFLEAAGSEGIPLVVIVEPDGTTTNYIGLDPFMKGVTNPNDPGQLNLGILDNLTNYIQERLK